MGLVQIPDEEEKEEEEKYEGPVLQISSPVLPEDYPLFDWADWPVSFDALIPGGATRKFEKACWNAILTTLERAAAEAGFFFYDMESGYGRDDVLMQSGVFGRLTADRMNAAIDAINNLLPLKWIWSYDQSFRGYVPIFRTHFYGYTNPYGFTPDIVYPEYILELAKRVNVIIELMRGTYPTVGGEAWQRNGITAIPGLRKGKSARIYHSRISRVQLGDTPVYVKPSIPAWAQWKSLLSHRIQPKLYVAGTLRIPIHRIIIPIKIRGEVRPAATICNAIAYSKTGFQILPERIYPSKIFPKTVCRTQIRTAGIEQIFPSWMENHIRFASWQKTDITQRQSVDIGSDLENRLLLSSSRKAEVMSGPVADAGLVAELKTGHIVISDQVAGQPVQMSIRSTSRCSAESTVVKFVNSGSRIRLFSWFMASAGTSLPTYCEGAGHISRLAARYNIAAAEPAACEVGHNSAIHPGLTFIYEKSRPLWMDQTTVSFHRADAELIDPIPVGAGQESRVSGLCALGTAWDPPDWHEGGLWIRQAKIIKIKPDGSMDLSGSGDIMEVQHHSAAAVAATLDNAWLAPVWHDDGLWIRQIREIKILEDGALDLTGAGDELLAEQGSRTLIRASLDTAWLGPVWHNGGLYLQQARTPKLAEDSGLDLSDSGDAIKARQAGTATVSAQVEIPREMEITIRQKSGTNADCVLDTAWEPPEQIMGGLYLRQAWKTVQWYNDELEVT